MVPKGCQFWWYMDLPRYLPKTPHFGGGFVDSLLPFVSGSCFYHAAVFFPDLLRGTTMRIQRGRISFAKRDDFKQLKEAFS